MGATSTWVLVGAAALLAACGSSERVHDPIDGIPIAQQETISRTRLGFVWPLSAGTGMLACADDGAILFRSGGVIYAVSGSRAGAADITPLRLAEPSPPPSNPVKRLTQNVRMDAFASLERCPAHDDTNTCLPRVGEQFGLSSDEVRLIDAEGQERRWPPLTRGLMSLEPLVTRGRALCGR